MLFGHFYVTFISCTSSICLVFLFYFLHIYVYIYVCACACVYVGVCVLGFVLLNSTKVKMQPK